VEAEVDHQAKRHQNESRNTEYLRGHEEIPG
jgi:hypothetical protein